MTLEVSRCPLAIDKPWHAETLLCSEENLDPKDPWGCRFQSVLGLPDQCYLTLPRVRFCRWERAGTLTKKDVRRRASLLVDVETTWRSIVMLGSKMKSAFYYERPFFSHEASSLNPAVRLVSLPGPKDREWCDARLVHRAQQLLREVVPSLPWGTRCDPLASLGFALRCAGECERFWRALPATLRGCSFWTDDDFMVALDAIEQNGLDRERGEYLTRLSKREAVPA